MLCKSKCFFFVFFIFCLRIPCSGHWIGPNDSNNTCEKLVNGSNGSWFEVSSRHYKQEWCELLKTCFQSQKLKERCLTDFEFYYHFFKYPGNNPKFTFEIGTYLSGTRILVTYDVCRNHWCPFAVSIIRCHSIAQNVIGSTYTMFSYLKIINPWKIKSLPHQERRRN